MGTVVEENPGEQPLPKELARASCFPPVTGNLDFYVKVLDFQNKL